GWMWAAFPIGWLVSHLLIAAIYFLLITPIALVMRAVGRDPLSRRFDRAAKTYWVPRRQDSDPARYFRQF
ncbi:MAG: SxtJ family membrane protein, partial [Pirellulales bacterium]